MAKSDDTEHEPLTEEQRITALEERVGTNKMVLLVVALLLIIVISVSITVLTLSIMDDDEQEPVHASMITELESKITELQNINSKQEKQIQSLRKSQLIFQEQLESTGNLKLMNIVIEQESAHQEFLDTLRTGMYDLAHMLPGSRTWLEVYGEKVDKAELHSKNRERELKALIANPNSEDEEEDPW